MDSKIHFLVVSDSDIMLKIVVAVLRELGYIKISEAENGEMALRALKTANAIGAPIDFIITDCSMPLMNGLDLIRTVRAMPAMEHLPILMVTAAATMEHIVAAINAGADSYLVKPFKATIFGKKIDKLLVDRGMKKPEILMGVLGSH